MLLVADAKRTSRSLGMASTLAWSTGAPALCDARRAPPQNRGATLPQRETRRHGMVALKAGGKDWSKGSVKSDLHWDVNQVNGYGVRTELMTPRQAYDAGHDASVGNTRPFVAVYFLVLPKDMTASLPHLNPQPSRPWRTRDNAQGTRSSTRGPRARFGSLDPPCGR